MNDTETFGIIYVFFLFYYKSPSHTTINRYLIEKIRKIDLQEKKKSSDSHSINHQKHP
jgi:hypothetical protein